MEGSRKCSGIKSDGSPCQNWAVRPGPVCWKHGAGGLNAKTQVRKSARRVQAEETARKELAKLRRLVPDLPDIDNPLEAFPAVAASAVGLSRVLEDKVTELTRWSTESFAAGEQLHPLVDALLRAQAGVNATLASFAKLNIDDRLASIAEARLHLVKAWLVRILEDARLEPEAEIRVIELAQSRLGELAK